MPGALLVILLLVPNGYIDLVASFPTVEACMAAIPTAHEIAKKEHGANKPYAVGCIQVEMTPKEPI
jgi:hypothetical protein